MHVLVTGGGGYLGCRVVERLLERGHGVTLLDRFCFGRESVAPLEGDSKCRVVEGDIRRLQELPDLFQDVNAVIHLAGLANNPSCSIDAELTKDVNVESTRELARLAVEHSVARFVFASTCDVYGKGRFDLLTEESQAEPVSPYGASKLQAEEALLAMSQPEFEPVIARGGSFYGASPRMRFDLAVNAMTAHAVRNGTIQVLGSGDQWRPFLHVDDAARAFVALAEAPAEDVAREVFNLGETSGNLQVLELANIVSTRIPDSNVEIVPADEETRTYRVDCSKIAERLDWTPAYKLDEGIEEVQGMLESVADPFDEQYFNIRRLRRLLETPVDKGGEPVAPRFIPLAKPMMGEDEERALVDTMRSGWLTSGPHVGAFERGLADVLEAEHVVGIQNCTSAIHLCLAHLGVQPGDEIILPPLTWASVGNVIVHMGAKPVFVDIEPNTLNIDPAKLDALITERTKAIIPVHMAGLACDMAGVRAVAEKHRIPVIEDAAHALGARYDDRPVGSDSEFACFSFYAIKNITTFEGGAIAVNNEETAERLRLLAGNGMAVNAWERYGRSAVAAPPVVITPGFKYAMGNVAAAIGLTQLEKLPRFLATRRRLANIYRRELARFDEIELTHCDDIEDHACHLMIIRLKRDRLSASRNEIAHLLRRENVGTGFHFWGLHLHPYFQETFNIDPESLPEATAASNEVLSLPLYPGMTDKTIADVLRALEKVLAHARK